MTEGRRVQSELGFIKYATSSDLLSVNVRYSYI